MATPADFFRNLLPYARRVSELTGVDPRLVLAQSALETGYGRSAPGQNYFGIKAPSGQGQGLLTQEFEGGQMVQRREPFRTYESPAQSFEDYANLLLRNERYRPVREARTIEDQIRAMGASGYATDPEYANKLRSIAMGIDLNDPSLIASDAMGAIGRGPDTSSMMATTEARPAMNGRQMTPGLLAQDAAATAQPMPAQPPAPGRDYGNLLDALAIGFSGMSLRPNQGLAQLAQSRIKARQDERRLAQTTSRTAAWLKSQGAEDLAKLAEMDPKTALTLYAARSKGDATALQKNYEFLTGLGISPEEALQTVSSGTSVNIDMGEKAGVKFAEQFAAADAKTIADVSAAGSAADRNLGRLDRLEELLASAPQGATGAVKLALGNLGFETEGLSDIQAAQALINSLVPEQRPAGSGPMSDADLALFKQSLPRIINQPGGNRLILDTMRRINEYDRQGALIVQELRAGTIDRAEAIRRLQSRADPLQGVPLGGSPTAAPAPADDERERALRLLLGE